MFISELEGYYSKEKNIVFITSMYNVYFWIDMVLITGEQTIVFIISTYNVYFRIDMVLIIGGKILSS